MTVIEFRLRRDPLQGSLEVLQRDLQELIRQSRYLEVGEGDGGDATGGEERGLPVRKTATGPADNQHRRERPLTGRQEEIDGEPLLPYLAMGDIVGNRDALDRCRDLVIAAPGANLERI